MNMYMSYNEYLPFLPLLRYDKLAIMDTSSNKTYTVMQYASK